MNYPVYILLGQFIVTEWDNGVHIQTVGDAGYYYMNSYKKWSLINSAKRERSKCAGHCT